MNNKNLVFNFHDEYSEELKTLPWETPLEHWQDKGVEIIDLRKAHSRHLVRFIKTKSYSFAIKQTTPLAAYFEYETYGKLLIKGIHTLIPAGYVIFKDHLFSKKKDDKINQNEFAFVITVVESKSIPHSILFSWDFTDENRRVIFKAVAELLATLHNKNIFWGDASLSNILIKFIKIVDEWGRTKTELKAFLADAETVQFFDNLNDQFKEDELNYFFSSLDWFNDKFIEDRVKRKIINAKSDFQYLKEKYNNKIDLFNKIDDFEKETGLNVKEHFYQVEDKNSLESILKQIEEHKWYLNENCEDEISLVEAAKDWVEIIYHPIINEFEKFDSPNLFPYTNSVSLYVQIMAHKYYLSIEKGKDVGIKTAILSYSEKYAEKDESVVTAIKNLINRIIKIFPYKNILE
ncbi:MAG: DUF4032 domain-containing protein [Melioribacteraceae bacterium]|nr:DUF4032 domain-containing protein [Melioribacteraceae bacterium]MCF8352850.1 DUF4032 domain-containing protein [Melioribacteraceae bacterium]MCF8417367.1 DUF4032 domain-containing protein [Melioribacteraceae bacterium]